MSLTITRGTNSFEYRQREQNPCELEGRATYKGARWQFIAKYDTPEQAGSPLGAALLDIEADWRQVAAEQEGKP
jgi:hypothetical protein